MGIEADLYNFLDTKLNYDVYAGKAPKGKNESLIIKKIFKNTEYSHEGNSGLCYVDYQFDAYSAKKEDAISIREDLKNEIEDYIGDMGDSENESENTTVQGVFLKNEFDDFEDDSKLYRETQEYRIQYYE